MARSLGHGLIEYSGYECTSVICYGWNQRPEGIGVGNYSDRITYQILDIITAPYVPNTSCSSSCMPLPTSH